MPCCAMEKSEIHHIENFDNCHEDDACSHNCSPFFTCGTCIGFTVSNNAPVTFTIFLRPVVHYSHYLLFKLPQVEANIWQPPQY